MSDLNFETLFSYVTGAAEQFSAVLGNQAMWLQIMVIIVVFGLAHWGGGPLLRRGIQALTRYTARVPSFTRVWHALNDSATALVWLILQWFAIKLASHFELPLTTMLTMASLLSAWLMIRFFSTLVANRTTARLIALIAWSVAALNIFGWLQPAMDLLDSWAMTIGQVRISPLSLIKISLALWFSLWLANGLAGLIERRLERQRNTNPATRVLIGKLARIFLVMFAILIALSSVGIDLTALAVFSGALGVGLGFGLQKIFSNLVSGVILLMDRSIKPGDVISLGTTFGWINHLGLRYTSVITRDGTEHLIPNEELITQRVENWSFSNDLVRLRVPVGVSYQSDVRLAMQLCVEAALATTRVQAEPKPSVNLMGFGDSSVNLELRIWITDPPQGRANVISEVLLGIWDRFHENDIQIPFPQRDLHLKSVFGAQSMDELGDIQDALKPQQEITP
jgi:small-conductance mechanosensitive channel